jgi:hypothetical protein
VFDEKIIGRSDEEQTVKDERLLKVSTSATYGITGGSPQVWPRAIFILYSVTWASAVLTNLLMQIFTLI